MQSQSSMRDVRMNSVLSDLTAFVCGNTSPKDLPSTPSSISRDRSAFLERVHSFKSTTWFAKPDWLSPIVCARYGWVNVDTDLIRCVGCQSVLVGRTPSAYDPVIYDACKSRLEEQLLNTAHHRCCPWPSSPTPESFVSPSGIFDCPASAVNCFVERVSGLSRIGDSLPLVDDSTSNLGVQDSDLDNLVNLVTSNDPSSVDTDVAVLQSACLLALLGWESSSKTSADERFTCHSIECSICARRAGVWNFIAHSQCLDDVAEKTSSSEDENECTVGRQSAADDLEDKGHCRNVVGSDKLNSASAEPVASPKSPYASYLGLAVDDFDVDADDDVCAAGERIPESGDHAEPTEFSTTPGQPESLIEKPSEPFVLQPNTDIDVSAKSAVNVEENPEFTTECSIPVLNTSEAEELSEPAVDLREVEIDADSKSDPIIKEVGETDQQHELQTEFEAEIEETRKEQYDIGEANIETENLLEQTTDVQDCIDPDTNIDKVAGLSDDGLYDDLPEVDVAELSTELRRTGSDGEDDPGDLSNDDIGEFDEMPNESYEIEFAERSDEVSGPGDDTGYNRGGVPEHDNADDLSDSDEYYEDDDDDESYDSEDRDRQATAATAQHRQIQNRNIPADDEVVEILSSSDEEPPETIPEFGSESDPHQKFQSESSTSLLSSSSTNQSHGPLLSEEDSNDGSEMKGDMVAVESSEEGEVVGEEEEAEKEEDEVELEIPVAEDEQGEEEVVGSVESSDNSLASNERIQLRMSESDEQDSSNSEHSSEFGDEERVVCGRFVPLSENEGDPERKPGEEECVDDSSEADQDSSDHDSLSEEPEMEILSPDSEAASEVFTDLSHRFPVSEAAEIVDESERSEMLNLSDPQQQDAPTDATNDGASSTEKNEKPTQDDIDDESNSVGESRTVEYTPADSNLVPDETALESEHHEVTKRHAESSELTEGVGFDQTDNSAPDTFVPQDIWDKCSQDVVNTNSENISPVEQTPEHDQLLSAENIGCDTVSASDPAKSTFSDDMQIDSLEQDRSTVTPADIPSTKTNAEKRKLDDTSVDVRIVSLPKKRRRVIAPARRRTRFDPVTEHQPWCPCIAVPAGAGKEDRPWIQLVRILLPDPASSLVTRVQTSPQHVGLAYIRKLVRSWWHSDPQK